MGQAIDRDHVIDIGPSAIRIDRESGGGDESGIARCVGIKGGGLGAVEVRAAYVGPGAIFANDNFFTIRDRTPDSIGVFLRSDSGDSGRAVIAEIAGGGFGWIVDVDEIDVGFAAVEVGVERDV